MPMANATSAERPEAPPRSLPPLTLRVPVEVNNLHPDIDAVGVSCTATYPVQDAAPGYPTEHKLNLVPSSHEAVVWSDAWMRDAMIARIPVTGGAASTHVILTLPGSEYPPLTGWNCALWVHNLGFEVPRGGPATNWWVKASELSGQAELYQPTPGSDFRFSDAGSF
jgi:hypothetical protein